MSWGGLRVPLENWLGSAGASRFTDEDLRRLWEGGYQTLEDLQIASQAGLERARLRPARADQIIHAQGAAAGATRAGDAGTAAGLGAGSAAGAGNDEQRSAVQLLRSPLPDSDVHPLTWKAAHTSGRIYKMKADDVRYWEYVQPEQEAAGGGEGGACSGNGQQLLVDAIRDHQDRADELYGRDLRLLRPRCVGSIDSEAEVATVMASAVTGPRALGMLTNAFLRLNGVATGIRAIWRQQPPSAIIQGGMMTGGPARLVYGQQAPATGPAAATGASPAATAGTGSAPAGAGSAPAGAGSAPAAGAGPAPAASGGPAAPVASAVVAPSSCAVNLWYKQDLLMTIEHIYDMGSSSSGCGIITDVGDVVTPQMVEPAASAGSSGWQGHSTGSQDQQQQQQLLEATLVPPPCAPPQPRPMAGGAPDVQQQQQVAGDCQGGGGSTVGGSACFQQLEVTAQVEAGPAAKRRRVQPQCACVGELKIISKLMVGKEQPLDLREAWCDNSHPRHAIAVAVLSQILTYMIAHGICYGFISCWLATWLVYCPPAGADGCRRHLLYVSDPFLSNTSAVPVPGDTGGRSRVATVYGALAFLQWRALHCVLCLQEPLQHMGTDTSPTGMGPARDGGGGAGGGGAGFSGAGGGGAGSGGAGGGGAGSSGAGGGGAGSGSAGRSESEQPSDSYPQLQGGLQQLGRQDTAASEPAGAVEAALQRQLQQMPAAAPGMVADSATTPVATAAAVTATAAAANLPRPSRVLLRFSETLAAGSEGMVMGGTCDGVDCIIKLLGPDHSGLEAYEREVAAYAALQRLQGRHVPELQAWGDLEYGVRFLALRRVAGAQPLSSVQRPLPAAVVGAALQALEAVQAACPGFIHGDVRLENMVVLEAAASDELREEQQLPAGLAAGMSTSQSSGVSAGARDEARGDGAGAASSGSLLLPRCVLLDFGRSRLDGDAAQQRLEREELRELLR